MSQPAGVHDSSIQHVQAPDPEDLRQKAEVAAARIVAQIKVDQVPPFRHWSLCYRCVYSYTEFVHSNHCVQAESKDVFINDLPFSVREQLTRRASLAYVEHQTGTSIAVQGRYYPPGAIRDARGAKALHLHIKPQQHLGTVWATC